MGFSPLHCEQAASFPHDVQGPAGSRLLPTSPGLWQLDGFVSTCSPRLSFLRYAAERQVSSKLSAWLQPKLRIFCYLITSLRVFRVPQVPSSPHLCPHGEQLGFGVFFQKKFPFLKPSEENLLWPILWSPLANSCGHWRRDGPKVAAETKMPLEEIKSS